MCIEGDCKIRVRSTGDEIELKEGNSTLIPTAIADYDVIPLQKKTRILDAYIDCREEGIVHKVHNFLHRTTKVISSTI